MDAEKWGNHYDRTKESEGMDAAMKSLLSGMLRELKSRADQAGPLKSAPDIVVEVRDLYREVADGRRELSDTGFTDYLEAAAPKLHAMLPET